MNGDLMELSREDQRELTTATIDIRNIKEDIAILQRQVAILQAFRWYIFGASATIGALVNLALTAWIGKK